MIKKTYIIHSRHYNDETFEKNKVFGYSGVMQTKNKNIMLLDFDQMAQYIIEECMKMTDNKTHTASEKNISAICNQWSKEISNMILDELYNTTISNIVDDEELILGD